jgi:hypothetical protein
MFASPTAYSSKSTILKFQRKRPAMMRDSLRFVSDDDRQCYRKGVRTLALVYGGILVLVVAITALRGELQEATAKTTAGAVSAADPAHPFSVDLGRERARTRQ